MRDDELPELNEDTDEFTPAQRKLQRREIEEYDEMAGIDEDDVPFRLPRVEDLDDDALNPAPAEADVADEADEVTTAEARAEDDAPPAHPSLHDQPTMPIPREPGTPDPKLTLPNQPRVDVDATMPNVPADKAENTMVNLRRVTDAPPEHAPYQPRPAIPQPPPVQAPARQLPPRPARKRRILGCTPGCVMVFVGVLVTFCGGLTLFTLGVSAVLGAQLERQLSEQVALVDDYQNFESTFMYDRNGVQLYEIFNEGRRINVPLAQIPQNLIEATMAIEDDNFYTNPGIDVPATTRAFLQFVGLAEGGTGGSTITQQLVRNVLFDPEYRAERSVERKVEEILLALVLTQRKSKDEILEMYLNEIYYGNLAYGAEAAANTFFNKSVGDLTLGEAALLAGLPQSPAELDPLNPDPTVQAAVERRWRTVLDRMVTEGFITDAERNEALRQGLTFNEPDVPFRAPHFTVFARQELERLMLDLGFSPEQIARGGLRVYTTIDLRINDLAQQAIRDQIARLAANNVTNGAAVVLTPLTGEILAMVGSADYNNDAIDGRVNVSIAPRQPGSTMKPFTYSAAIEMGFSPADVIWDTPLTVTGPGVPAGWPRNYDGRFHGPMRMREALANSYNIPAVSTLRRIGVGNLLAIMQRFGVRSLGADPDVYGLSLTLGGGEVTLLELSRAYAVFANQGLLVPTTSILCVVNSDDQILYQYENTCPAGSETSATVNRSGYGQQVLDPRIAFLMSDILGDNAARSPAMGGNSPLYTPNIASSVKTGTTDNVKDNWTVGYTRNITVGVWVGNSNGDPMVNSSGLTGAAPIWNAVISGIYNQPELLASAAVDGQLQADQLQPPGGLTYTRMCNLGRMIDPVLDCPATQDEWLLDTPAGLPTADGVLQYPAPVVPQPPQPVTAGPNPVAVEPGVYRVLAQRIPPEISSQITFSVAPGQPQPPSPIYCQVPVELAPTALGAGAQEQLFIAPPDRPEEAVAAEEYARQNNLAFLPTIACDGGLLAAAPAVGANVVTAFITSPAPGAVLTQETPIIGTVQFTREQAWYYKVEVRGENLTEWTTLGTTHENSVDNGWLENIYVPGLVPGNYVLRLVIVDNGGGFLQPPYEVPFSVVW